MAKNARARQVSIGLAWTLILALASLQAGAQTAEQLEVFRSLSPSQQQQILESVASPGIQDSEPVPTAPILVARTQSDLGRRGDSSGESRLRAGDTLLLSIESVGADDRGGSEYRERMLGGNPYRLDRMGRLALREATEVVLAGLTVSEATQRLNADPQFRGFTFKVSLLPVHPELRSFGYELFSRATTTFAPATDIPVPAEYVVGPGDSLEVQLIGERGGRYTLTVGRDGVVDFPEIGPIAIAGMRFVDARALLEQRVSEQLIGMRASISIGALRSIQIFVLGDAEQPGSYTVSGLSTITNALISSGGVRSTGTLRNIQLKRGGAIVRTLDLYDLLLNGDTSNDARLLPGDVIFIPPVGMTAAASGEFQRPAIYEVREGSTAADLIHLAGGLTPSADPRSASLERISGNLNRTIIDLDLAQPRSRSAALQSGDYLRVNPIRESLEGAVALEGHVHRASRMQFRAGMRLTDLIGSLGELKPLADLNYALIRRESGPERRVSVVSADIAAAFADAASADNVLLQARDRVIVFDLASSRDRYVAPVIADFDRQSRQDQPRQVVSVGGRVKVPGQYPLEPGMTVSDLLRAGGGLDQSAYASSAELTRYEVLAGEQRRTQLMEVDLAAVSAGDGAADVPLMPFDYLVIREVPAWGERELVTIEGEVRFPGTYPIKRGETVRSLVTRAGGLTNFAFAEGSVFTREELQKREQRQLEVLAERLQRELASLSLEQAQSEQGQNSTEAMAAGRALLSDLKATQAVGRLVIQLDVAMHAVPGSEMDIVLKGNDRLVIPRRTQEVTVIGEVQSPTSHLFQSGLTRNDYVVRSGDTTMHADEKRIYVIRANGEVAPGAAAGWFNRSGSVEIRPGDTIVVPLDAQQMRPLSAWTSITQILFNIAVAVAAVNSF